MIRKAYLRDRIFMSLHLMRLTLIVDGLRDEVSHDFGDRSIVFSAAVEDELDNLV
jgi:hypothetical protein